MLKDTGLIIIADTSVLVNFLRIDRMDLIGGLSARFLVTDHVIGELSDLYSTQAERFRSAVSDGYCEVCRVDDEAALEVFGELMETHRLGVGESATIAYALTIGASVALDDRRAANEARRLSRHLPIVGTADLMLQMIAEGLLNVAEADRIKEDWAANHRFRMNIASFGSLP